MAKYIECACGVWNIFSAGALIDFLQRHALLFFERFFQRRQELVFCARLNTCNLRI